MLKVKVVFSSLYGKLIIELRNVTCHMRSHYSVTSHPTEVTAPRGNPSQTGWSSIYLPRKDRRL